MNSLVAYASSDEDISEADGSQDQKPKVRKGDKNEKTENYKLCEESEPKRPRLALPETIQTMFNDCEEMESTTSEIKDGRVRTFAHERGNWASYVYVKFEDPDSVIPELTRNLIGCLKSCDFRPIDDLHISLSRTFVLRHHWIEPLVSTLKGSLRLCNRCASDIDEIKLYTNDEKTRTFLSLQLGVNEDQLKAYVHTIDRCLQDYKLPKYYEDPSFHMSIAWAPGDVIKQISDVELDKMNNTCEDFLETYPKLSVIDIDELHLKAGNKTYPLPLG